MTKRSGTVSLVLLIILSAVLTLAAGTLLYLSRSDGAIYSYEQGLLSVYGAESGANWALAYLKQGHTGNRTQTFSVGDRQVKVMIRNQENTGTIQSSAGDTYGNHVRYLKLTYTVKKTDSHGKPVIVVEDISSEKF